MNDNKLQRKKYTINYSKIILVILNKQRTFFINNIYTNSISKDIYIFVGDALKQI